MTREQGRGLSISTFRTEMSLVVGFSPSSLSSPSPEADIDPTYSGGSVGGRDGHFGVLRGDGDSLSVPGW